MPSTMPRPQLCERFRALITLRAQKPPMNSREICAALKISRQTLWRWEKRIMEIERENREDQAE